MNIICRIAGHRREKVERRTINENKATTIYTARRCRRCGRIEFELSWRPGWIRFETLRPGPEKDIVWMLFSDEIAGDKT